MDGDHLNCELKKSLVMTVFIIKTFKYWLTTTLTQTLKTTPLLGKHCLIYI